MSQKRNPDNSLVVAQRELTLGQASFLRIDNGTQLMNVDGRPAGSSLIIWNGTGGSDTGGDWTASGDGSESASADAGSGTNGWDSGAVGANSETYFDNGSMTDIGGTYDTLTFELQPKKYPNNANLQLQWRNDVGAVIGATLNVEDYVTNMDLDVWQTVSIPIADFNLTGNVQVLRVVYKTGSQHHWIDDVQVQASGGGGPFTFRVAASSTEHYHVTMMVLVITAADTGWASSAFANIAGGLTNGLLVRQRRLSTSETLWSLNSKDNIDLFGRYHPQDTFSFSNNEQLVGLMLKPSTKASIVVTDDDVLEFIVQDDTSSLSGMRAFAHFGVEAIT